MSTLIVDRIVEQLKALPYESQQRVLEFARGLQDSTPHGLPGDRLLRFAGVIPPDDLQLMQQTIEEGCERVDADEW